MSHECEECGHTFQTLTKLRLHDCSSADVSTTGASADTSTDDAASTADTTSTDDAVTHESDPDRPASVDGVPETDTLDDRLDAAEDGQHQALHGAVATYESAVTSTIDGDGDYQQLRRAYNARIVAALDDATRAEGWPFLEQFIEAYHPDTAEELPQVTTVLQNVVGRWCIRTRLNEDVDAIPVTALEYFDAIRASVGEYQDFVREGLHPYGWGIGHPDHPVADRIHDHATAEIFLVNPLLEHAFYADQHAAIDLLERLVADDAVTHPGNKMGATRYLIDAVAGADSDEFWPTLPRYLDWEADLDVEFALDESVRRRARDIVVENGLDEDLPSDWALPDLMI